MNSEKSKNQTNKYLNNDVTKLVPALVTVSLSVMEIKARGKKHFLPSVAVLQIK